MDNNLFSFKELYDVYLKATYPIEIKGRTIEKGETICKFDKIQLGVMQEEVDRRSAKGGFDNREHVYWETTKDVQMRLTQGVFSKTQFALLSNSHLIDVSKQQPILISKTEELETNEKNQITLKEIPKSLFVYDKTTGEKLTPSIQDGQVVTLDRPFLTVIVEYEYEYVGGGTSVQVGRNLLSGYIALEGKTRTKDDVTGQTVTGLIKIPRLKLVSDLSIRLGSQAGPVVGGIDAIAVPTGERGNSHVVEFFFLNNDIDSDF